MARCRRNKPCWPWAPGRVAIRGAWATEGRSSSSVVTTRHYTGGTKVKVPTLDAERGYVIAPQLRGLRITSGAEIARQDAAPTPRQINGVETIAGELMDLGRPVESEAWLGSRPCCADVKPIIGAAPLREGLWVNCGHGHQGFTLGPASARLLADLMEEGVPCTAAEAFSPTRFRG